jgi:hypothetical protein
MTKMSAVQMMLEKPASWPYSFVHGRRIGWWGGRLFAGMSQLIDKSECRSIKSSLAGVGIIYLLTGLLVGIGIASRRGWARKC